MMRRLCSALLVLALAWWVTPQITSAEYSSTNYKANEIQFGIGGDTQQQSSNYQAQVNVGSIGAGNSSSTNYQAYSGFLTPNEPFLELGIDTSTVNLGLLDSSATKTGTANFHVRAYINSDYTVQTVSQPPVETSGPTNHTLAAMTSMGSSVVGIEQFGMNLRVNTVPAAFGANPAPQPDASFANGQASTGYNTVNQYKYSAGDTIVQSTTPGWGATNYTISYIANASLATPTGNYTMIHDLVVIATY